MSLQEYIQADNLGHHSVTRHRVYLEVNGPTVYWEFIEEEGMFESIYLFDGKGNHYEEVEFGSPEYVELKKKYAHLLTPVGSIPELETHLLVDDQRNELNRLKIDILDEENKPHGLIFTIENGWEEIIDIYDDSQMAIQTKKGEYTYGGKRNVDDLCPSAWMCPPQYFLNFDTIKPGTRLRNPILNMLHHLSDTDHYHAIRREDLERLDKTLRRK